MMKPILFNTEMVRAILDGRKTVTRRIVKNVEGHWGFNGMEMNPAMVKVRKDGTEYPFDMQGLYAVFEDDDGLIPFPMVKAPYSPGDTIYVREAWGEGWDDGEYLYKATDLLARLEACAYSTKLIYKPAITMPRAAARIFLRVADVRVERLQDISREHTFAEGAGCGLRLGGGVCGNGGLCDCRDYALEFTKLWDSTLKPADLAIYGWDANPWVFVISFERISKDEALQ